MITVNSMPETYNLCQKIKSQLKTNPNNWIIVDKWNYKFVYLPNRNKIFLLLLNYLDNNIPFLIEQDINNFTNIKDIGKDNY